MKKLFTTFLASLAVTCMMAQGWPANYGGVMLQGFYWDSFDDEDWGTWSAIESHADDLEGYIDLIWVPNSARTKNDYCLEKSKTEGIGWLKDMGYMPCWWLNHDNTIFGNTATLKSMIDTYKAKGIGIIEDVVINHKNGENDWCDFVNEHVEGTYRTYDLTWSLADICENDNGGTVKEKFPDISGAADTGDDFDGCRDLDHTGANVQQNVKTYLDFLQDELGYAGFRYDMVKGYAPQYIGIYNKYAQPTFSVGEYWDNWGGITWWLNGTKQNGIIQSAAFDFPMKFQINSAFNGDFNASALSSLGSLSLAGNTDYQRYSVTFIDNHDTNRDESIPMTNASHVLAANAFILAMPGTPCVFLKHWQDHKEAIKKMIAARKVAGITNQSTYEKLDLTGGIGFKVQGTTGSVIVTLGSVSGYNPEGYHVVVSGNSDNKDFCFYVSDNVTVPEKLDMNYSANNNLGTARVDMGSGTYYQSVTVNVSPSDDYTTLVYTEDGSDPTTGSSTITASGKTFIYDSEGTYTLKVGVIDGTNVKDIQTYRYVVTNEEPTDITIYVRADKDPIYLYAWDADGTLTAEWPGTQLSAKKSVDGKNFYYMTFPKPTANYSLNYILNQGGDDTKTPDQLGITSTIFTSLNNGSAIDLTASYAGLPIEDPVEAGEPITVYVKGDFGPAYLYTWNGADLGTWPGTKMSTTLINGHTWFYYTMPETVESFNLIVNQGQDQNQSSNYEGVTSTVYLQYNSKTENNLALTTVDGMSVYPRQPWYEQGEICAFFVIPNGWTNNWKDIHAKVSDFDNNDNRGDACVELGFNENGEQIWKWTTTQTDQIDNIVFNSGSGDKTEKLRFVNGAWYSATSYQSSGNTEPVSEDVDPSTEISVTSLTNASSVTANNWNGKSEIIAQNDGDKNMTKDFSLAAGNYIVQAIVRGTSGKTVTLSAKDEDASVDLTGLDGAPSAVKPNGTVEKYATGANNGWQKVELPFTLSSAEKVTVTLSSTAGTWQLGALELLPGTTKTKATSTVNDTYVDATSGEFSFYERGANPNALIEATAGTQPALLTYNVIVGGTCANLKLTDGNYSFGYQGDDFTATSISYDRTFTPGQTSTVCLPFALTAEEVQATGSYWELDSYDDENDEIVFKKVETTDANTPYIFEAAKAQPFLELSGKAISAISLEPVTIDGISFIGVNERMNIKSDDNYTCFGYRHSDHAFVKIGTGNGANINPFRAYLKVPASKAAARINVLFDGENGGETGIRVVKPEVKPTSQQPIYNMSGQRVKTPAKKGIYIIGGKKFVIK